MFIPLHIQSEYSLLESCIKIESLVKTAHGLGYEALALTDHHTMGGLVEFYYTCGKYGLKPILGIKLTVTGLKSSKHLILLAENNSGYRQILQLASLPKPVTIQQLSQHTNGILALICFNDHQFVRQDYQTLAEVFGNQNLFVELLLGTNKQQEIARHLAEIFPAEVLVAGQNVYYLQPEEKLLVETMWALQANAKISDVNCDEPPLLKPEQISKLFQEFPEAVKNTVRIAERCRVELMPETAFPQLPEDHNLRDLVITGAKKRYFRIDDKIRERLEHELNVIEAMDLADYFLIVWDIVRYAKENQIPVGPGRGSAASSLVAYCLGITDVDPILHNLFFERFLNPKRQNLPDIDLDFCYQKRDQIIEYVVQRYGSNHVARIGTYGTFGYKNAFAEVKRIHGRENHRLASELVGLKQYASTHAAGVIITPQPVLHYSGVENNDGVLVTQLAMDELEKLNLLKIDFLGLRNLTILHDIATIVQKDEPDFRLESIPQDDSKTFEILSQGLTLGIFQLESNLFQELLPQIKPNCFADLVALLALGRPGPLKQVPVYIQRRNGEKSIEYVHPRLESILAETYGLVIYQEQVMQLGHEIGGFSLAEADLLRVAMTKKDYATMKKMRTRFIAGCQENGLDFQTSNQLYLQIERFADYAFNKAHSTAYSTLTWQLAYLKANYPIAFYLGLLQHTTSIEKIGEIYRDCIAMGIKILPPDIRFSEAAASREGDGIRIGLSNLKHLGSRQSETIVSKREESKYTSAADFYNRVELNINSLYALVYAGALDSFGSRDTLLHQIFTKSGQELESLNDLTILEREKEYLGIYLSGHPITRWRGFLEGLERFLGEHVAGHIVRVREDQQVIRGTIVTKKGSSQFILPASSRKWHNLIQLDNFVALFGKLDQNLIEVGSVLPLKPILLIEPHLDKMHEIKKCLLAHQGGTPIFFKLGQDLLQLIDPTIWVKADQDVISELEKLSNYVGWIDPWQSRVLS